MTEFTIELGQHELESEGDIVLPGSLIIGNFKEDFLASLSYWGRENYLSQWRESILRLLNGKNNSAVVTAMYDPEKANFIFWWVMYLIEECVHIQNHVLFLEQLDHPFDENDIYQFIPPRETHTSDGEPISEWVVNISDLEGCFRSLH
jgi:hypothetical protein